MHPHCSFPGRGCSVPHLLWLRSEFKALIGFYSSARFQELFLLYPQNGQALNKAPLPISFPTNHILFISPHSFPQVFVSQTYSMCMSVLSKCVYGYKCAWCLRNSEEGEKSLGTGDGMVVVRHMGVANLTLSRATRALTLNCLSSSLSSLSGSVT